LNCPRCHESYESGTLHSCQGASLHAPWLDERLKAVEDLGRIQAAELGHMRALLEVIAQVKLIRAPENPEAKTRAAKRETRVYQPNHPLGPNPPVTPGIGSHNPRRPVAGERSGNPLPPIEPH
jgi:hypothetical protein